MSINNKGFAAILFALPVLLSSCGPSSAPFVYFIGKEEEYPHATLRSLGEPYADDSRLKDQIAHSSFRAADISTKTEDDAAFSLENTAVGQRKTELTYFVRGISLLSERSWTKIDLSYYFFWVSPNPKGQDFGLQITVNKREDSPEEFRVGVSLFAGTIITSEETEGKTSYSFANSGSLLLWVSYSK